MLNEEALIEDELKIKIPTRAKIITLVWLSICVISFFFWLNFFYDNKVNSVSLGDIGAFLSGVFSVLAFYGFIEAYLVQSQELRLQRFELKESIKAQKGSEQALKEQSEALKAQLKINEEKFNLYLLEAKAKIPVFTLSKIHTFKVEFLHEENRISNEIDLLEESIDLLPFERDSYKLTEITISVEVNNIGGGGRLVGVKSLTKIDSDSCIQYTDFNVISSAMNDTQDNYLINFKFKIHLIDLDVLSNSETFKSFIIDFIENIKFETNFRNHERSYKQNYKICRTNFIDSLLQHFEAEIRNFEQLKIKYLISFGYEIEIFD